METILIIANTVGKTRRAWMGGRSYIVAPLSLIVPGVLNGSHGPLYYPAEEISKSPEVWNNTPIVVYHPFENGKNISARRQDVIDRQGIGMILKAQAKGKLSAEGWFDIEAMKRVDNRVLEALEAGQKIEISTGLFCDNEKAPEGATYNGRPYTFIARNYRPDHLAILPDQIGACSIADGCGVLVNSSGLLVANQSEVWGSSWSQVPGSEEDKMAVTSTCPMSGVTNTEYDVSLSDKTMDLSRQLCDRFGMEAWLSDVYDAYIVYSREGKWFRLAYEEDEGFCTLSDEKPVEVRRVTVYEPTTNTPREEWIDMALNQQQRTAIVEELTTNCDCWKHQGDKEILANFTDDKLLQLKEAATKEQQIISVANAAVAGFSDGKGTAFRVNPSSGKWEQRTVTNTPKKGGKADDGTADDDVDEPDEPDEPAPPKKKKATANAATPTPKAKKPQTADEWFRQAPADVQTTFQMARQIEQREKDKIIGELLANVADSERAVHRERLLRRSIDDLANDLSLIPKQPQQADLERAANQRVNNKNRNRPVDDSSDMLTIPTINWSEVGDDVERPAAQVNLGASDFGGVNDTNDEEWLKSAPRTVQNAVQNAMLIEGRERQKLIEDLTSHISDDEQQAQVANMLRNKSLKELQTLLVLAPRKETPGARPNYFGQSAPAVSVANKSGNASANTNNAQDDILPLPRFDWKEEARKERNKA